ncbi:hypothetical protein [Kordiimonas aquimaris]|uniref:hypothetical protein n=1 Tax=Kordiimonas aquimaris TaxID=707591 RepID=UPI0021D214BB|nr:hypothetical protein [Kordiimonas aquimaris]
MKAIKTTIKAAAFAGAACALATTGYAVDEEYDGCKGQFTFVDSDATYEDFDFWLGDWQVVATESGELRSVDDVKMTLDGCVIEQHWTQMDDLFSAQGSPNRLRGTSLTGIDATGKWRQVWTDTSGSNFVLTGGLDEDGVMVLTSEWITAKDQAGNPVDFRNIWHWKPMPDGTIHNWGFLQRDSEDGKKTKYFDITYHRSVKGGSSFVLKKPEE